MANDNPWMSDPASGGGAAGISGPGGANPAAKKKKKNPYKADPSAGGMGAGISGPGGENPYAPKTAPGKRDITGPGSIYHGWNTPGAAEGAKQWGVWGPLTGGAGGTGGKGGSAFNYLTSLDPSQKQAVFGWLGKNYNPAQGQTGNIAAAQELLKKGDFAGFLKLVGAGGGASVGQGGGGNSPISGPGGINPAYGQFGMGGGGGMNAPINGPLPGYGMGYGGGGQAPMNGPQFSMDPNSGGMAAPVNKAANPYLNAFRW